MADLLAGRDPPEAERLRDLMYREPHGRKGDTVTAISAAGAAPPS